MPQWFVRGLRRGVVTTRYPAGPEASAASLPTPPAFRQDQLSRLAPERAAPRPLSPPNPIGRGAAPGQFMVADLLVSVCPSGALRRDGYELVFDVGACTSCGECRRAAPDAVVPSGEFELAATSRDQLIKRIPLRQKAAT